MHDHAIWAAGTTAFLLSVLMWLPQLRTTALRKGTAGLSQPGLWLNATGTSGWLVYSLAVADPIQVATNATVAAIIVVIAGTAAALTGQRARRTARWAALPLLWSAAVAAYLSAAGADAWLYVAASWSLISQTPQPVALWRAPAGHDRGVSRAALWAGLACSTAWIAYGLLIAVPSVWAPSAVPALGIAASLAACLIKHRPARPTAPLVPAPRAPHDAHAPDRARA